jgi:hypothetical protein
LAAVSWCINVRKKRPVRSENSRTLNSKDNPFTFAKIAPREEAVVVAVAVVAVEHLVELAEEVVAVEERLVAVEATDLQRKAPKSSSEIYPRTRLGKNSRIIFVSAVKLFMPKLKRAIKVDRKGLELSLLIRKKKPRRQLVVWMEASFRAANLKCDSIRKLIKIGSFAALVTRHYVMVFRS